MRSVDARGRSCPEPIMMARASLKDDPEGVVCTVDDFCAVENIARFAANAGYQFTREDLEGEWKLTLTKR